MRIHVLPAIAIRRLMRLIFPMPRSPVPRTPEESERLKLVPAKKFTDIVRRSIKQLRSRSEVELGDYAEFGVYNGNSLIAAYEALKFEGADNTQLVGFDSFEGLPREAELEDGGVWREGLFTCRKETAVANIEGAGVPKERYRLISGWYKEILATSPYSVFENGVSLVMIDCDTYSSARLALNYIGPVLKDCSIIIFDDWRLNDLDLACMGELRAFREFLLENPKFSVHTYASYSAKSAVFLLRRVRYKSWLRQFIIRYHFWPL